MDAQAIAETLGRAVPEARIEVGTAVDSPLIFVDRDSWPRVAPVLRDEPTLRFELLSDVTALDCLPREPRFEVVYLLVSLGVPGLGPSVTAQKRLRVKVRLAGTDPRIRTVSDVWPSANWAEREVFDMFGITFDAHPDLRRVLMPEDWEGHPLKKDYPVQIRRAVKVYAPLQLSAEEFAHDIERIRRVAQETGTQGVGRAEEGEVGQRFAEPPTRRTEEKYERKDEK
jgi:NADH-quinone oxidoreductase subunit C